MSRTLRIVSLSLVALLVLAPTVALCDGHAEAMPCCPEAHGSHHSGSGLDAAPGALDCCATPSEAASSPAVCVPVTKLEAPAAARTPHGPESLVLAGRGVLAPEPLLTPPRAELELSSSLLL